MINRRMMLGLLAASPLLAQPAVAAPKVVFSDNGLAINGFDPVAYFTAGSPTPGQSRHALVWKGAVWQFANAHHQALFEMNPAAYAPQYGGHCAFAMAQRALSDGDPTAWALYRGNLYLTASLAIKDRWSADMTRYVEMADSNWRDLVFG